VPEPGGGKTISQGKREGIFSNTPADLRRVRETTGPRTPRKKRTVSRSSDRRFTSRKIRRSGIEQSKRRYEGLSQKAEEEGARFGPQKRREGGSTSEKKKSRGPHRKEGT